MTKKFTLILLVLAIFSCKNSNRENQLHQKELELSEKEANLNEQRKKLD